VPGCAGLGPGAESVYIPDVPICASCGKENPAEARFCLPCGSPFAEMVPREVRRR
jgi:predicted amidophosphoribosyltransferase